MSIKSLQADVLIAGAGPAGLTAAIYLARAGKKALVLEGRGTSRMAIPYTIENYPGFSSIGSVELLELFRKQAVAFGAEIISGEAIALAVDGRPKYVTTKKEVIACEALILATGRPIPKARLIGGEGELVGQGVSYCATCDGPLYRGLTVAAVGDTAEALEEVRALHDLGCMVLWVPGGKGSAPDSPEAKALEGRGVTILRDAKVKEIRGGDKVETILLETAAGAETLAVAGVFIFREIPSGPLYGRAGLSLDHAQCLVVDRFQRTSVPGVFAAGDITCGGLQVVAAAGEGCVAALQALVYLRS